MTDRLTALHWALDRGHVTLPDDAVVWRAPGRVEGHAALRYVTPSALEVLPGVTTAPQLPGAPLPGALAFLGRDREENLGTLGALLGQLAPGAPLVTAASNALGASWYDGVLQDAGLDVEVVSKNKCRVARVVRPDALPDAALEWAALLEPAEVAPGLWTCPGVFSKGHVDPASAFLARTLPTLQGRVGDWGAGWGFLAASVWERSGGAIERLELVEADARALRLAEQALRHRGAPFQSHWRDARQPTGLRSLDAIVSNPPFHDGDRHAVSVATSFLASAASALRGAGHLYVVGPRNLPYDEALRGLFERTRVLADDGGLRVHEASHPRRGPVAARARGAA